MRDPYLYEDVNILKNRFSIKDADKLSKLEADIVTCEMASVSRKQIISFSVQTIQDIHKDLFGEIYEWAGEFRSIQMIKKEEVLGGDTVRYAYPKEIKKQLSEAVKEISKLKKIKSEDKEVVYKMVRIIANIWQIHPFREGNTRTVITFSFLLAKSLGFTVQQELFKKHSSYVRNALVWASQGIYSRYEYLEKSILMPYSVRE